MEGSKSWKDFTKAKKTIFSKNFANLHLILWSPVVEYLPLCFNLKAFGDITVLFTLKSGSSGSVRIVYSSSNFKSSQNPISEIEELLVGASLKIDWTGHNVSPLQSYKIKVLKYFDPETSKLRTIMDRSVRVFLYVKTLMPSLYVHLLDERPQFPNEKIQFPSK